MPSRRAAACPLRVRCAVPEMSQISASHVDRWSERARLFVHARMPLKHEESSQHAARVSTSIRHQIDCTNHHRCRQSINTSTDSLTPDACMLFAAPRCLDFPCSAARCHRADMQRCGSNTACCDTATLPVTSKGRLRIAGSSHPPSKARRCKVRESCYHAMPCHAMPRHAMPCHAMPCHAMPCRAVPCRAVPCHAMSLFTVRHYATRRRDILSTCVYIYIYIYIHIHTYVHTHTSLSPSLSLHIYIYIYTYCAVLQSPSQSSVSRVSPTAWTR